MSSNLRCIKIYSWLKRRYSKSSKKVLKPTTVPLLRYLHPSSSHFFKDQSSHTLSACVGEGAISRREGLCSSPALMGEMGGKPTQEISSPNRISGRLGSRLLFAGNYLFHKVPKQKASLSKVILSYSPLPPVGLEPSCTQCHHVQVSLGEKGAISMILVCLQFT